jgi:carbonic anhydrase/acetyltransferase-like protein (isoleucine patch superfamily)
MNMPNPESNEMIAIDESALVSDHAVLIGSITVDENCSIWPFACLRGDPEPVDGQEEHQSVRIGSGTNVQEFAMIHGSSLGDNITVGHTAVVDHASVHNDVLIGISSVILAGATIESNCIVAANTVVKHGQTIPSGHLAYGTPAEIRPLTDEQLDHIHWLRDMYVERAQQYKESQLSI